MQSSSSTTQDVHDEPTPAESAKPREETRAPAPIDSAQLRSFVAEMRRSFSHDLRTPLGTIVNYAAMLETGGAVPADEVQSFARNIRRNAMRAANMLEHVAAASMLAVRAPAREEVDLRALLERALLVVGSNAKVRWVGDPGHAPTANADAALLSFVWSAFLTLEADAAGAPPSTVELALDANGLHDAITVSLGAARSEPQNTVDVSRYLLEAGESSRPESRHALRLAAHVAQMHGVALEFGGRAGSGSSMRVLVPRAS